jgi:hypothetical protein
LTFRFSWRRDRYDDAPEGFHRILPAEVGWLDGGDRMVLSEILRFDLSESWRARCRWDLGRGGAAILDSLSLEVQAVGEGTSGPARWLEARSVALRRFHRRWLGAVFGRWSRYRWPEARHFLDLAVELSYLTDVGTISVTWGFDPVVFDPLRRGYRPIGWDAYFRQVASGVEDGRRGLDAVWSEGTSLGTVDRGTGARLADEALRLEESRRWWETVKLEWVLSF